MTNYFIVSDLIKNANNACDPFDLDKRRVHSEYCAMLPPSDSGTWSLLHEQAKA